MSIEIAYPTAARLFVARNADGSVLHIGQTTPSQVTTTGQPTLEHSDDINEHLATVANWSDQFDPLPDAGVWLEAGTMYRHGDGVVQVRQDHIRTEHDPADVLALFLVAREPGTGIEWIAGEDVGLGVQRTFDDTLYQTLQGHVTQDGWEPPATPALWEVVQDGRQGADEWQPDTDYVVDDERTYDGTLYRCLQSHRSQTGWEPPNVPALWEPLP